MSSWSPTTVVLALSAVGAVGALAACDRESPPTSPDAAVTTAPTAPSGCSFSTLKQAASRYFSNKTKDQGASVTDQQLAYNLINAMSQAADPTRSERGFDLLALVARVTNTGRQIGTAAQGSAVAYNTVLCTGYGSQADAAGTYTVALSAKGLFGVRSADNVQNSVDPSRAPVVARRATGDSLTWGLEPPTATTTWAALTSLHQSATATLPHRVLFYSGATTTNFQDAAFTDFDGDAIAPIELKTIPSSATFAPFVVVGYCTDGAGKGLIAHGNPTTAATAAEIIPYVEPRFCTATLDPSLGLAPRPRTPLELARALVGWGADLLRPAPLSAMFRLTLVGGGKGSLSPFAVVQGGTLKFGFANTVTGAFEHTLGDATTTTKLPEFAVKLTTSKNTPIDGATIRITVSGNSGSFNLFHDDVATPLARATYSAATGSDGIARFSTTTDSLRLDKAGGYTIRADLAAGQTQYSGYTPAPVDFSNLFHITQ
jgi:hypothetical protein